MQTEKDDKWLILGSIIILLLSGYWWYSFSGPFKWISELQIYLSGRYSAELSVAITVGILFFGVLIPLRPEKKKNYDLLVDTTKISYVEKIDSFFIKTTSAMNTLTGRMTFVSLIFITLSAYFYISNVSHTIRQEVTLSALERGSVQPAAGAWLLVEGKPLYAEATTWDDKVLYSYIPLVSNFWVVGQPVSLVMQVEEKDFKRLLDAGEKFDGTLSVTGIPSDVANYWNSKVAPITSNTLLLRYKSNPAQYIEISKYLFLLGMAVGLFAFVLAVVDKKKRKTQT